MKNEERKKTESDTTDEIKYKSFDKRRMEEERKLNTKITKTKPKCQKIYRPSITTLPYKKPFSNSFSRLYTANKFKMLKPTFPFGIKKKGNKGSADEEASLAYKINNYQENFSPKQTQHFPDATYGASVAQDNGDESIPNGARKCPDYIADDITTSSLFKNNLPGNKSKIDSEETDASNHYFIDLNYNINTLEDALNCFGISSRLQELDESLCLVKCGRKTKEEHERLIKQVDKHIQKLSLICHPDRMKNTAQPISEEEMSKAHEIQASLNITRTVINYLSKAFLEDIYADHKYEFYTKLDLKSIGNESQIKNCFYEVLSAIDILSKIKQQYIICEIRRFLKESQCCIRKYFEENVDDFKTCRDSALLHLELCIEGYESLHIKFSEVKKECHNDKLDNLSTVIHKMEFDCKRDLTLLRELKKAAKHALNYYQPFIPNEFVDPYFVLPFISYVNILLMCNSIMAKRSFFGGVRSRKHIFPDYNDELFYLEPLVILTLYHTGKHNKEMTLKIINDEKVAGTMDNKESEISQSDIRETFNSILKNVNDEVIKKFKVENYVADGKTSVLKEELEKCMTMKNEFKREKRKLSEKVDNLLTKLEAFEERLEKYNYVTLQKPEPSVPDNESTNDCQSTSESLNRVDDTDDDAKGERSAQKKLIGQKDSPTEISPLNFSKLDNENQSPITGKAEIKRKEEQVSEQNRSGDEDTYFYRDAPKSEKIITLEYVIAYFDLSLYFQRLEGSLINVRKHQISEEDHWMSFKRMDDKMQELNFTFKQDTIESKPKPI